MKKKVHLIEAKQLSHQLGAGVEGKRWINLSVNERSGCWREGRSCPRETRAGVTQQTNTLWKKISSQI